ncbi:type II toxin-antitoxin system RelE/ParE family toxin [bacterium]|nr:type II toxin-antitoxin system RelE/ParE family toxin [bacterium]
MIKQVIITDIAKEDIKKLAKYISSDNKNAAVKLVDDFYKTFELLSNFPETGVIKDDIPNKTIRIYTMRKNFAIVYRFLNDKVEILRVLTRYQNIFAILN